MRISGVALGGLRHFGIVAVATVLAAACAGTANPTPTPTAAATPPPTATSAPPTPQPTAAPTAAPTATPVPTATPTAAPTPTQVPTAVPAKDLAAGWEGAGVYSFDDFVKVTFTAGPEWSSGGAVPEAGFFLQYQGEADGGLLTGTHFDGQVFDDPCDPGSDVSEIDRSPVRLIEHIGSVKKVRYPAPLEFDLAGYPGLFADITYGNTPCDGPVFVWTLPVVGDFHFEDNERVWFAAAQIGDQTFVLAGEAFNGGTDYDGFKAAIETLLSTMTIEP